jgi:ubiquinone/menaquinone biosynthesis C-methylase UbiE
MPREVFPWWAGYLLLFPARRLLQDPRKILGPYVSEGMTVLEPGPAMGFFTLELARLVGPAGRVIAVDIQPRMLKTLVRRARRARLADRIEIRLATAERLHLEGLEGKVDFCFACAMVHEVDDQDGFFREIFQSLKVGGRLLVTEPVGHVPRSDFEATVAIIEKTGFASQSQPRIRASMSVLFLKTAGPDDARRASGRGSSPCPRCPHL